MSATVRTIFRTWLPGQGKNAAGDPVSAKQLAILRVVTVDVQSGLESLTALEMGFSNIDFLKTNVLSASGGIPAKSATTSVHCDWDDANQRLVICDVAAAGDRAAITNDEDPEVDVLVVGDASTVPELLP